MKKRQQHGFEDGKWIRRDEPKRIVRLQDQGSMRIAALPAIAGIIVFIGLGIWGIVSMIEWIRAATP